MNFWNEAEEKELKALYDKGLADRGIGKRMGRSWKAVAAKRRAMGLKRGYEPFRWTRASERALRRLWGDDKQVRAIGRELGCCEQAVRGKVKELGLPKRTSRLQKRLDGGACAECHCEPEYISICPLPRCPHVSSQYIEHERSPVGSSFEAAPRLRYARNRGAA